MSIERFRKLVWAHYKNHGRHDLPWRKTEDPYKILVSEVMLQQTQVGRVLPFYVSFVKRFPTAKKLAGSSLSNVLTAWQGLGYNRRAKMLQQTARAVVSKGKFPHEIDALEKLPGVGPYTARALAAFAFNTDCVVIETNIRTAVISAAYKRRRKVSDAEIEKFLTKALPKGKSREWYAALMDYGSHLKQSGIKLNARSAHYAKQSRFPGSAREARGTILRALVKGPTSEAGLVGLLGPERRVQVQKAAQALVAEGLIQKRGKTFSLAH